MLLNGIPYTSAAVNAVAVCFYLHSLPYYHLFVTLKLPIFHNLTMYSALDQYKGIRCQFDQFAKHISIKLFNKLFNTLNQVCTTQEQYFFLLNFFLAQNVYWIDKIDAGLAAMCIWCKTSNFQQGYIISEDQLGALDTTTTRAVLFHKKTFINEILYSNMIFFASFFYCSL